MPQTINNMVQEWTNALTTYTAIKMNIPTDVSAAGSLLMDLQVGGSSKFKVGKDGLVTFGASGNLETSGGTLAFGSPGNGFNFRTFSAAVGSSYASISTVRFGVTSSSAIGWSSSADASASVAVDTILTRRAAANLRLGAADAAGSAIAINSVASNQLTLASNHGLTTGAAVQITFTAGGAVPSGTAVNTTYYARSISAAVLELYGTYDQALNTASTTGRVAVTTAGTNAFVNLSTPFQSFGVQDFTGTDIPGQPFIIRGSRGTGTGAGGSIIFQVAPAGSTGTAQNALETVLTINPNRTVSIGGLTINPANGATTFLQTVALTLQTSNALILRHGNGDGVVVRPVSSGTSTLIFADTLNATQTALWGEATNTLALRNGTNAQTFRVYNTTDGTNSEFGFAQWSSNVFQIGTGVAGTGANRAIDFVTNGATRLSVGSDGHTRVTGGRNLYLGASTYWTELSSQMRLTGGSLEMVEQTAPPSPATNNVRIYAEDNGSGKTRLMALFATGAAVQIAIEP